MAGVAPEPLGDAGPKWLAFEGTATVGRNTTILRPALDATIEVELANEDARVDPSGPAVRLGAKAIRIHVPQESPLRDGTRMAGPGPAECKGFGSSCIGRVEFCCTSLQAIGSCHGYWSC
jgi:hypothetical protein